MKILQKNDNHRHLSCTRERHLVLLNFVSENVLLNRTKRFPDILHQAHILLEVQYVA
jgi:hypothetical protein